LSQRIRKKTTFGLVCFVHVKTREASKEMNRHVIMFFSVSLTYIYIFEKNTKRKQKLDKPFINR